MTSTNKQLRKSKNRLSACSETLTLVDELKIVIKSLNDFLKKHFEKSATDLQEYTALVKEYFIQESTNSSYSCAVGSLFSKISNMLQPFIQPPHDPHHARLKEEVSSLQLKLDKSSRKIRRLKQELNQCRETSSRLTSFVYMLRVNNIDVDLLYERGCDNGRRVPAPEADPDISVEARTRRSGESAASNLVTR